MGKNASKRNIGRTLLKKLDKKKTPLFLEIEETGESMPIQIKYGISFDYGYPSFQEIAPNHPVHSGSSAKHLYRGFHAVPMDQKGYELQSYFIPVRTIEIQNDQGFEFLAEVTRASQKTISQKAKFKPLNQ